MNSRHIYVLDKSGALAMFFAIPSHLHRSTPKKFSGDAAQVVQQTEDALERYVNGTKVTG